MVDWYKTMSDMADGENGPVIGEISITSRVLKVIGSLLLLACAFHVARLWSGSVSWLGMAERDVRVAPEWVHTPFSTNLLSDNLGLSLPVFALKGQEIVIQYRLSSAQQTLEVPYARVMISCFCRVEYYGRFGLEGPGSGEIAMPVRQSGLYSVSVSQSAGPKGEVSTGSYYWGIRAGG